MKYYLVLAQYIKTGKNTWWVSNTDWLWKAGQRKLLSGSTVEVLIKDVIEISENQSEALM